MRAAITQKPARLGVCVQAVSVHLRANSRTALQNGSFVQPGKVNDEDLLPYPDPTGMVEVIVLLAAISVGVTGYFTRNGDVEAGCGCASAGLLLAFYATVALACLNDEHLSSDDDVAVAVVLLFSVGAVVIAVPLHFVAKLADSERGCNEGGLGGCAC